MPKMKGPEKSRFKQKIEEVFLSAVRKCLNDEQALQRAGEAKSKYPGLTRNALADVLT